MTARERLRAYLELRQLKPAQFARDIEYDKSNFHRLLTNPDAMPSLDLATKIERKTDGLVPATSWAEAA